MLDPLPGLFLGPLLGSWLLWLILLILFLVTEALSPSFVTVWLAVGSLAALIAERLHFNFTAQVIIFTVVSVATICFLRPFCVRILGSKSEPTNIAALIGREALTLTEIEPFAGGQAKVGGQVWTAVTDGTETIPQDHIMLIKEIRGVKLVLESPKGERLEE
ncbi:NfeD family protein [Candidatus Haliotispira prima]|uniref:NfeD family protein n=1 Tax=Candidatus Haliotispira prima TaxID=3034016 RepID=A0ABY8MH34_9SPIO|nr:NfeD family protein [Candidatus Haliotispira prima]